MRTIPNSLIHLQLQELKFHQQSKKEYTTHTMVKANTFFILALLLCFTLCSAARPVKVEPKHAVKAEGVKVQNKASCAGISEEECLMRKTEMAHLDYIYTQSHGNP